MGHTATVIDPERIRAALKEISKVRGSFTELGQACGVAGHTISDFALRGANINTVSRNKIVIGLKKLGVDLDSDRYAPPPAPPTPAAAPSTPAAAPKPQPPKPSSATSKPVPSVAVREVYEEDASMVDASVQTAPMRVVGPPPAPPPMNPNDVKADVRLTGPALGVKAEAARLGESMGHALPVPAGTEPPASLFDRWLKMPDSTIRVDRIAPVEEPRILEPAAPQTLSNLMREVEDRFQGGTYKVRVYSPASDRPLEQQFRLPGAPRVQPSANGAAKGDMDAAQEIQREIEKLHAEKRRVQAQKELEELRDELTGKKKPEAPAGLTAADVARIVQEQMRPIVEDRREKGLKQEIIGELSPLITSLKTEVAQLRPREKPPEVLVLEAQLADLRASIDDLAESRTAPQPEDKLTLFKQFLGLVKEMRGGEGGPPKEKSDLIMSALEEMLLEKIRGNGSEPAGADPEESTLKVLIKELAPAFKEIVHEMAKKGQAQPGQPAPTPDQIAAAERLFNQRVAAAAQQAIAHAKATGALPAPKPAAVQPQPQPQPQPQIVRTPAPSPAPAAASPQGGSMPASSTPPERRDLGWVNETLRTLVKEINEGCPRDCEWLGVSLDFLPENVLDGICNVDTAEELRSVLAQHGADPALLAEVERLGNTSRRIKDYIQRGIMTIRDEWNRDKAGEGGSEGPEPEPLPGEVEPPRV